MNFENAKAWQGQLVDGKFPLLQWLGGSDHSAVFLTEVDSAKAAIKLIAADTLDANLQLLRWQQAAQLVHPHLTRLLTEGRCQIQGAPLLYLVMDYADETLSEILQQRALTTVEMRDLLQSVLEGLAYLHGQGFVHSRVQPPNILAQGNQIKLSIDCIRESGASGEVVDSARRGSVYDAPELTTQPASPALDSWSVGVTIVEALTQHPTAQEPSEYQLPRIPAAVPEPFRSIARDCLRRDPAQRCTADEIKARLTGVPAVMTATPEPEESKPSRLRLLIPVAAIILLAAVFVGPKLLSHHNEPPAESRVKTEPPRATPAAPHVSPAPAMTPAEGAPSRVIAKGEVVHQVLPPVPQSARNTIHGKVRVSVEVQVDSSGKVTSATLASAGPSKYFARLALKAAEEWKFKPPERNGQAGPSAWLLRFQFGRSDTQVSSSQEHQ